MNDVRAEVTCVSVWENPMMDDADTEDRYCEIAKAGLDKLIPHNQMEFRVDIERKYLIISWEGDLYVEDLWEPGVSVWVLRAVNQWAVGMGAPFRIKCPGERDEYQVDFHLLTPYEAARNKDVDLHTPLYKED